MSELTVYNTDELRDLYLRDFKLRQPDALVSRGTAPYVDAMTVSGITPALFKNAQIAADRALISKTFGSDLDTLANDRKKPRLQGSASVGSIIVNTSITGATIPIGSTLKHKGTGEQFKTTSSTAVYFTGNTLGVISVGIGRQTVVSGILIFDAPPAGVSAEAIIIDATVGGSDIEKDVDLQTRLIFLNGNPPADGNAGSYLDLIYSAEHGVPVNQAFVYPAIVGSGSIGVSFTVEGSGILRIPTAPQLSIVETYIKDRVPFDDCIFMLAISGITGVPTCEPVIGIKFQPGETGFLDPDPFPKYNIPVGVIDWRINNTPTPTALTFSIKSSNGSYSGSGIRAGQTIALWNPIARRFVAKRILSFSGVGPYTIIVDPSHGASDISYVPGVDDLVSPWSTKLNELAQPIVAYYDNLSPGENTTDLPDPGYRMRRFPQNSVTYPYGVTSHLIDSISARDDIQNSLVLYGLSDAPLAGTPGVDLFMFILMDIAFYGILWHTFLF